MTWFERQLTTLLNGKSTRWADWAPTFPGATMTYTGTSVLAARYCLRGKICHFQIRTSGTLGGSADTKIDFTLPVASKSTGAFNMMAGSHYSLNGATYITGFITVFSGSANAAFYTPQVTNWGLAVTSCVGFGIYEVD